jgi:hypothetical protein
MCGEEGHQLFYRLHGTAPNGKPHSPIFFSRLGRSRFDPIDGLGTLCLGRSLAGVLMEIFDDKWGAVNTGDRVLTETRLNQWWVTRVWVPKIVVLPLSGMNLSKIGTDAQLFAGLHATARQWALSIMRHPAKVDGMCYPSRHNEQLLNLAVFNRPRMAAWELNPALTAELPLHPDESIISDLSKPAHGLPIQLKSHPEFNAALAVLQVALVP